MSVLLPLSSKDKWNKRHQQRDMPAPACKILHEFRHLLPDSGIALDLASGLGGNAVLLANSGLVCEALDISDVAVSRLNTYAQDQKLAISASVVDVEHRGFKLSPQRYDVIVVSYFLYRPLFPILAAALKPNGLLFYQTFLRAATPAQNGPKSADFYLREKELVSQFNDFEIPYYYEGETDKATNEAMLVARKPQVELAPL